MSLITPQLSKAVGWDDRIVKYPTEEQVDNATDYQLLEWYRFLPCAESDEQLEIINKIFEIVKNGRERK